MRTIFNEIQYCRNVDYTFQYLQLTREIHLLDTNMSISHDVNKIKGDL